MLGLILTDRGLLFLESVHGLQAQFLADSSLHKVNLMQGVYRVNDGPFVLPSVIQVCMSLPVDI